MKLRDRKSIVCHSLVLFVLLPVIVHLRINYVYRYSTLTNAYCSTRHLAYGYPNVEGGHDRVHIQQCSLINIDACQRITNRTLLFRLDGTSGFASELNNLLRTFVYAIHERRKLLIDDHSWNYGSFSTYFNVSQGRFSPWLPSSPACAQRQFVHVIQSLWFDRSTTPDHLMINRDMNGGFSTLNSIMKNFDSSEHVLQTRRIVTRYVWSTMNEQTRGYIDRRLQSIQIQNIDYGLHIRRGDKLNSEAGFVPTEKYVEQVERLMRGQHENGSHPRVFVASDEQTVLKELQSLRRQWEFVQVSPLTLLVLGGQRGHRQDDFNDLPLQARVEATLFLLTELEALARVKYVVCTFSSNICRLVQILRSQEPTTVTSLDQPWYPQ